MNLSRGFTPVSHLPKKTNKQTNNTGTFMVEICQHNAEGMMPQEQQRSPDVA